MVTTLRRLGLCQYDLKEPFTDDLFWKRGIITMATFPEGMFLGVRCKGDRQH